MLRAAIPINFLPAIPGELFKENNGFKVEFYDGQEFEGQPIETKILKGNKFWAMGGFGLDIVAQSKRPSLSVRFTGELQPKFSGEYDFEIFSIGPSRLSINGKIRSIIGLLKIQVMHFWNGLCSKKEKNKF